MARELSVYRFALVNRGDVRLPALCPPPVVPPDLAASVARFGILVPLLVRPATRTLVVQEGRAGGRFGYFLVDSRRGLGMRYDADPPWFVTRAEAEAALPADVPYEVVCGRRRLVAARFAKLRAVPCIIGGLTDEEAEAVTPRAGAAR